MKIIIPIFLLLLALTSTAQTITWNTNLPSVTVTVSAPDTLKANGRPLELYFATGDFSYSNGVLRLAPRRDIATNAATFLVPVQAPYFMLTQTNAITTVSNSTFGFGAGLMSFSTLAGTNYTMVSIGTNRWGRVALETNW